MREGAILLNEDFSQGMDDWWAEGGEKVWVEDGRLHQKADPAEMSKPEGVCTVWHKKEFPANIRIEFEACCLASAIDANNVNFFFGYTHPEPGKTIWDTRDERADGDYPHYHVLSGNIITFLNDFHHEAETYPDGSRRARIRIRHCPGFELLDETFDYHCRQGRVYQCRIDKCNGEIMFYADGNCWLKATDPNPPGAGLIGLRTFRTHLWWGNIRVTELIPE